MSKQHYFSFDIHVHVFLWKLLLLLFAKLGRIPNHVAFVSYVQPLPEFTAYIYSLCFTVYAVASTFYLAK